MNTINYLTPEEIAHRLEKPRKQGKGWMTCCPVPAHDDKNPSFSINENPTPNSGPLVHCHAGCDPKDVIAALQDMGAWPEKSVNGAGHTQSINTDTLTTYKYHHANGDIAFETHRIDMPNGKKSFYQSHDGKHKAYPAPRPIYNLPAIMERSGDTVLIVEGEKTAIRAAILLPDYVVTTSAGGSKAANGADWTPLQGRRVLIWPDADDPGKKYADKVARLANKAGAQSVRIVPVPDTLKKGWDLADTIPPDIDVNDLLAKAVPWNKPGGEASLTPADKGNELELSDNLIIAYADKFAYRIGARWYKRKGSLWELDNESMAIKKQLRKDCRAAEFRNSATVRNMVKLLEPDLIINTWDDNKEVCGLPSGNVIDLRTGIVREAMPSEHITRRLGCDPKSRESELWLKILTECLPDLKCVEYLKLYVGYCLTGYTREQNFIFAHGTGANGKSTILGSIAKLLGDYHVGLPASVVTVRKHDEHPEALARLDGARLATLQELPGGGRWNEERIKQLTGGDPITARLMRENSFDFIPQCKLITSGNSKPRLSTVDTAIERRLVLLPFNRTFQPHERDELLPEQLENELPGILEWGINGAMEWLNNGLPEIPASMKQASKDYMTEQDIFGEWFAECIVESEHGHASNDDLLNSFNRFTKSEHHATITKIGDYILQHMPQAKRGPKRVKGRKSAVRGIFGIELADSHLRT